MPGARGTVAATLTVSPAPPPFPQTTSEKWQKRFFVAKDGFLLYYSTGTPTQSFFDTKPKVRTRPPPLASTRQRGAPTPPPPLPILPAPSFHAGHYPARRLRCGDV